MKDRKIPLRKCVGCNEQKSKKELIRIVKCKDGEIFVDFTGKAHGRGAYICPDENCLKVAQKRKSLNRAFQQQIPDEIYEKLTEEFRKNGK